MSSPAGSEELVREATPAIHRLREHALDGERPRIGELRLESPEGPAVSCSIVVIAEIEGSFLVGVPQTAWHRTAGRRYLPRTALTRTVLAEVLAADGADPTNIRPGVKLKVWLGLLQPALEEHVDFGVDGALEPDVPFLGYGSRAQERLDPFGPSLSAIASEHFAFHTPAEEGAQDQGPAGEEAWEDRLTRLEAGMLKVQESMQLMLDGAPITDRRAPSGSGVGDIGPRPQASAKPHLAGLDPAVVEAARAAGIPEDQLTRMSQLATKGAKAPGAKAKAKAKLPLLPEDPLDESEDDVAAAEGGGALVEGSQPGAGAEKRLGGAPRPSRHGRRRSSGEWFIREPVEVGRLPEVAWSPSLLSRAHLWVDRVLDGGGLHRGSKRALPGRAEDDGARLAGAQIASPVVRWADSARVDFGHDRRPDQRGKRRAGEGDSLARDSSLGPERDRLRELVVGGRVRPLPLSGASRGLGSWMPWKRSRRG